MAYAGGSPNMSARVTFPRVARVAWSSPSWEAASVSSSTRARCQASTPGTSASSAYPSGSLSRALRWSSASSRTGSPPPLDSSSGTS
ncbi:hypothetical protein [Nonomuraea monospora]|uniref:hypothetical protein n=1 Tax=Nonomuraea monospora TaxID=568818 RepID=UPI0031E486EA